MYRGADGVDLRLSSLIALARVLDLELFLAPKKSMPAINSITRSAVGGDELEAVPPAYSLDALEHEKSGDE